MIRTDTQTAYLESINKAINFLETHIANDIVLTDVAQHAHISPYHFHRIFKALTGETVKVFLTRIRLENAATKLKQSKADIGQIAIDYGYQNHETFSRVFKEYFKVTPTEYRQNMSELKMDKQLFYEKRQVNLATLNIEKPIIKTLPDLHLAYIRHTGSYDKVGASFQRLMLWAACHWALKLTPTTIGIVHDDPDLTADAHIRFDACVLTIKPIEPKGEVGFKTILGGKYAVFRYKGDYDGFYPVYDYIYNVCLFDHKFDLADKPALEWYVKSPPFYKPNDYVTDFYVPIK
jgi:AraC family transcriptional regulator